MLGRNKGNSTSQTVKAAKRQGNRDSNGGTVTYGVQGAIGDKRSRDMHACDEFCGDSCPVKNPPS